jgi:hypothetical protein
MGAIAVAVETHRAWTSYDENSAIARKLSNGTRTIDR